MLKFVQGWQDGYDPATCNNGGGYWQPTGYALVEGVCSTYAIDYEDLSCGDLGTRKRVKIEDMSTGYRWRVNFGTMEEDASIMPDELLDEITDSFYGCTGDALWPIIRCAAQAIDDAAHYEYQHMSVAG